MSKYNKLVRDKIPEIIESTGDTPIIRILDEEEYEIELKRKLEEEKEEVMNVETSDEVLEELADMLEVIFSIAMVEGKDEQDLLKIMKTKREKRGAFTKRIYLDNVIKK